jgi:hypothetical protein
LEGGHLAVAAVVFLFIFVKERDTNKRSSSDTWHDHEDSRRAISRCIGKSANKTMGLQNLQHKLPLSIEKQATISRHEHRVFVTVASPCLELGTSEKMFCDVR